MITHDGGCVVCRDRGFFLKTEEILYIKGGYNLVGLTGLDHFCLYSKKSTSPIRFDPNSVVKREIFKALKIFIATYSKTSTFLILENDFVVDCSEISNMVIKGYPDKKYYVIFKNGFEVDVPIKVFVQILDLLMYAVEKDNAKYNKVEIPGFMDTRRRKR